MAFAIRSTQSPLVTIAATAEKPVAAPTSLRTGKGFTGQYISNFLRDMAQASATMASVMCTTLNGLSPEEFDSGIRDYLASKTIETEVVDQKTGKTKKGTSTDKTAQVRASEIRTLWVAMNYATVDKVDGSEAEQFSKLPGVKDGVIFTGEGLGWADLVLAARQARDLCGLNNKGIRKDVAALAQERVARLKALKEAEVKAIGQIADRLETLKPEEQAAEIARVASGIVESDRANKRAEQAVKQAKRALDQDAAGTYAMAAVVLAEDANWMETIASALIAKRARCQTDEQRAALNSKCQELAQALIAFANE